MDGPGRPTLYKPEFEQAGRHMLEESSEQARLADLGQYADAPIQKGLADCPSANGAAPCRS
jgi:hypothetical protein